MPRLFAGCARRRSQRSSPALIPGGGIPWLLVSCNDLFEIFAEVLIEHNGRISLLGFGKNVGDRPSATMRRPYDSHGPMILLLHDHLAAMLNLLQHSVQVAGEFGLRDSHRRHALMIA